MKKHRLKKLADQDYMEFPAGIIFRKNLPFDFKIDPKDHFTGEQSGTTQHIPHKFMDFQNTTNPEWSLLSQNHASVKNKK